MKKKWNFLVVILAIILVAIIIYFSTWSTSFKNPIALITVEDYNYCEVDDDCVISLSLDFCPDVVSVNREKLDVWENYVEMAKEHNGESLCEKVPLLSDFIAECHENRCEPVRVVFYQ